MSGASDTDTKAFAKNFFEANLTHVSPADTLLNVTLPNSNTGGGTLKLCAHLHYHPYFLPAAAMLIGKTASDTNFTACSGVRLKNTLEVALVLDNSGSMDETGFGTSKKRLTVLKDFAKGLIDLVAAQARTISQLNEPVQFALVPFAASVNVGPDYYYDPTKRARLAGFARPLADPPRKFQLEIVSSNYHEHVLGRFGQMCPITKRYVDRSREQLGNSERSAAHPIHLVRADQV